MECCEYGPGVVFTILHFLYNLWMDPMSYGVCSWHSIPALCSATLLLIWPVHKLRRKWSVVNTAPASPLPNNTFVLMTLDQKLSSHDLMPWFVLPGKPICLLSDFLNLAPKKCRFFFDQFKINVRSIFSTKKKNLAEIRKMSFGNHF